MTDYSRFYSEHLKPLKWKAAGEGSATCPFHKDHKASLSVNRTSGLWHCFACNIGGTARQFAERLSVEAPTDNRRSADRVYDYRDEKGALLFQVVRFPGKTFRQRRPDSKGGWLWKLGDVRRVPYRLPELLKAKGNVFIVEGEKDVETLRAQRLTATCNPGGAGKWRGEYGAALKDRVCILLPDNDDPGRAHMRYVADKLRPFTEHVITIELPGLPDKGDVSDWFAQGHKPDELLALVDEAAKNAALLRDPENSTNGYRPDLPAASSSDGAGAEHQPVPFPEKCIRGTAADWIGTLEPRGEWPRAYLFAEWRAIHSMAIARSAWYGAGHARYPHCHDLLIGESGITHKNTSIYRACDIIRAMRPKALLFDNVSSIEGILEQMDEARTGIGIIACGEYSYLVATGKRQGTSNIIPVLNHAYDGVDPLTITKKKAPIVREPFLNLMAGCTPAWIAEYADKEGADLGRFNRCVVFYAGQDRDISHPQHLTRDEQADFARRFGENLDKVLAQPGPIVFDAEANERSDEWFMRHRRRLRSLPDNLRKLLEREDDQVQIQAIIYAAADGRRVAIVDDVEAAIALVEWSGKNKLLLFGEVEFNADQRLERRMQAFIERGAGTLKELYRYLGGIATSEAVHRKLRSFAALGLCELSRAIDQPSREPLRIISPDFRRKNGE